MESPLSMTSPHFTSLHCFAAYSLHHYMSHPQFKDTNTNTKTRENKGRISKSTLFTGLLLFLGLSWISSQSIVIHKFRQHFPATIERPEGKMSKRTVGYFVCSLYSPYISKLIVGQLVGSLLYLICTSDAMRKAADD